MLRFQKLTLHYISASFLLRSLNYWREDEAMAQDSDSASSTVPLMRAASQVWGAVHRGMDKDVWMVVTPYVRESFPHRDYGFEIVHA